MNNLVKNHCLSAYLCWKNSNITGSFLSLPLENFSPWLSIRPLLSIPEFTDHTDMTYNSYNFYATRRHTWPFSKFKYIKTNFRFSCFLCPLHLFSFIFPISAAARFYFVSKKFPLSSLDSFFLTFCCCFHYSVCL